MALRSYGPNIKYEIVLSISKKIKYRKLATVIYLSLKKSGALNPGSYGGRLVEKWTGFQMGVTRAKAIVPKHLKSRKKQNDIQTRLS